MDLPLNNWPILEVIRLLGLFTIQCVTSYLVKQGKLRVNYSRKVLHFSHLLSTLLINRTFFNYSIEYFIISGSLSLAQSLIFVKPIRKRIRFIGFLFLSYDRPEDRPHTVRLATTQILGMNIVLVGLAYLYGISGVQLDLLALPLVITAFGDGLAEPIGVRFGKRKYRTKDLFGDRVYTRSYEGSAMVFLTTIVALSSFYNLFSLGAFACLLAILPLLMTITEAHSPHTWDNPFLYLIGGLAVYVSVLLT
jgi:dolichol kinase